MKAEQTSAPRRPPFRPCFSSSFAGSQYFDAIDGTVSFDGYDLVSDVHRFIHFDQRTMVLIVTTRDSLSPGCFWMDMAQQYPATRFTFLVDTQQSVQCHHNVDIHVGSLQELECSESYDLIHFQRPLSMSELNHVVRISKPGACVQTVQFHIKMDTGETLPPGAFTPHIHDRLHLIRGSTRWYKLDEARKRDPEGYQQLKDLMGQLLDVLYDKDEKHHIRSAALNMIEQRRAVEFGQCVMLLERLY